VILFFENKFAGTADARYKYRTIDILLLVEIIRLNFDNKKF